MSSARRERSSQLRIPWGKTYFAYDRIYTHNIISGKGALERPLNYAYDSNYNKMADGYQEQPTHVIHMIPGTGWQDIPMLWSSRSRKPGWAGNIIIRTDKRGHDTEFVYDIWFSTGLSHIRDRTGAITVMNNRTEISSRLSIRIREVRSPYAYDKAGRMVSATARNGLVTKLSP